MGARALLQPVAGVSSDRDVFANVMQRHHSRSGTIARGRSRENAARDHHDNGLVRYSEREVWWSQKVSGEIQQHFHHMVSLISCLMNIFLNCCFLNLMFPLSLKRSVDHPFNPHVFLKHTLTNEELAIVVSGSVPEQLLARLKKVGGLFSIDFIASL